MIHLESAITRRPPRRERSTCRSAGAHRRRLVLIRDSLGRLPSNTFEVKQAKTKGPPWWAALLLCGVLREAAYGTDVLQWAKSPWPKLDEKMWFTHAGAWVKSCTPSERLALEPWLALTPRPRSRNASQMAQVWSPS